MSKNRISTGNHRHLARKRFGQNFLHDQAVIGQIVACIAPTHDDHLVEIGPGLGALTQPLLRQAGKLIAIELDRDLILHLQSSFGLDRLEENKTPSLTLINADALQFDFAALADSLSTGGPLRMVGNLPYNISTPLLFHLLTYRLRIRDMHFMLQKEVVDRMVAEPGTRSFGRLSVMMQYFCDVESLLEVAPEAFSPAPKVRSAVARLQPKPVAQCSDVSLNWLEKAAQQAFATRRKTLRNNFRNVLGIDALRDAGFDPGVRAETLQIADFVTLAKMMQAQPE